MFENGRPRYWIDWYDPWYFIVPLLLSAVLAGIRWLPASLPSPVRPTVTTLPSTAGRPNKAKLPAGQFTKPVDALPPLAPTTLDLPLNGKAFFQSRMPDAAGRTEPGALVFLEYATLDLADVNWRVLSQMPADASGYFQFKLENFPPGSFRLRARMVTATGREAVSGSTMMTVFADPKKETRRRTRK